ncbi:mucin-3A-like [Mya arenaria]|uniref:mucin-3A-like n=1 Tax=Mya arenaria TaxID=6604 RepID=UPI0022E8A0DE|nr:mucin-3A-like [Mya arenaria]
MTTIGTAKTTGSQLPPTTVKYMLTSEKQCTDHETDMFKCEHFNRTYNACQSSDLSITTIVLSKCLRYCGLCDATTTDSQHLTSTNAKPGTTTEMYTTTQNNLHDTTTGKNVFDTTTGATPAQTQAITTTGTTKTTGSQLQSTNAQYISTTENQCTDHETDMLKCEQFNHTYNACQSSEWSINIIVHSKCLRYCGLCDATTPGSQHLTSSNIKPGTTTETFTTSQNNLLDITTGKNVFDTTTTNYLHHTTTEKQITFSQPKSSTQLHVTQTTDFIVTATSSIRHQTAATTSSLQPNGLGPQVTKNFLTSTDVRSSSHDASTPSMVLIRNNVTVSNTTSDVPFTATSRSMNTFSSTDATTAVDSITTFPSKSTSSSNKTTLGTH